MKEVMNEYILARSQKARIQIKITAPSIAITALTRPFVEIARAIGQSAANLSIEEACYELSNAYTMLVSDRTRSRLGMYYTPPALSQRLLDMTEETGVNWRTAFVLDPACGGGAFLLPVAMRMKEALRGYAASRALESIARRLHGFEIDPFAAWLTQVWLEIGLSDLLHGNEQLPQIVQVCDALRMERPRPTFDLVIGNPPYGRVTLSQEQRRQFLESLYGHANLYGVFTHIALRWVKPSGAISYLTPTSVLSGEYFKSLRALLAKEAAPAAIDILEARRGVFEDVLQETMLAVYRKSSHARSVIVNYISAQSTTAIRIIRAGRFDLPAVDSAPWIIPRSANHQILVRRLCQMKHRLKDWGYSVSTGPLVWNRYKGQLRKKAARSCYPLIWAEAVSASGYFSHRAEKRSHQPFFEIRAGDEWLKVFTPCVLVQRTTAKEQRRRLIAAELPASFLRKCRAVIIENHLNMIRPRLGQRPKVNASALTAVLNSKIVDEAFRCISGSVAVSAFELEALPLPSPEKMAKIEKMIANNAEAKEVEKVICELYFNEITG